MARTLCVLYPELASKNASESPVDRSADVRWFESVVQIIEDLVPRVEVAEPGVAYVPVEGAVRYYGGEKVLAEKIAGAIPPGGRIGLADGPFAARQAAARAGELEPLIVEDTAAFLRDLEIDALGPGELADTFRWLGVTTLGALARLPRAAVASRFGPDGLTAHRLAAGEDRRPMPRPIPPEYAVESRHIEEPLVMAEQVAFLTRSLAARLLGVLSRDGLSPFKVMVEVEAADGTVRQRTWRSADPFTEHALAERVWWQVRAWMDTPGGIPGGVVRLRLDPSDLSGEGRQLALLEPIERDGETTWQEVAIDRHDAERALARAQALVGPDAVLQAVPKGGRMPHEQVEWYPWGDQPPEVGEDAPWPGKVPPPSPALASPKPPPIEVEWDGGMPVRIRLGTRWETVLSWAGPWRMVGRWWEGEGPADRYQIVTSVGAVLCFVKDGRVYLAGVYD